MNALQPPAMTLPIVKQIAVVTANGSIGEILSTALFAADSEQTKTLMGIYAQCRVYIYPLC